ncbi:MAG: ribonuclease J, partial [Alphaproteobacteria bacterium]
ALAISTPVGTVLHVTDWKLDPKPLVGPKTDEAGFRRLGEQGVIAMVCDSTNVLNPGRSGSEGALRDSLIELVGRCSNRVVFACFASNVARLETIAMVAEANGRHVGLVGRSLWRINEIARENGYLADVPPFLSESEAAYLPRDKVVIAATGSQGEYRAALARIATDSHPNIVLEEGDTVIFSSRVIPGNEKSIGRVQNQLSRQGIEIITESDHFVHVSGHPARDEVAEMYDWVKPPLAVPIHGEQRHLAEHLRFARDCGVAKAVMAENGTALRLYPGPAEVVGHATTGRFAVDGKRMLRLDGDVLRKRRRMGFDGIAVATLVIDEDGVLQARPQLALPGLVDGTAPDEAVRTAAIDAITETIGNLRAAELHRDADVAEAARRAVRRAVWEETGRRPLTEIHVVRT